MVELEPRSSRHEEIRQIVDERSGGVREARDEVDKYTVVGAADRSTFANWLTPIEEHFVCHRNDIPDIDGDAWTVSLTGQLDGSLSMSKIKNEYPIATVGHTMECAGNGRGQHEPETGSVQWEFEAAATAFWTGTPLDALFEEHEIEAPEDCWLTAVGGDPSDAADVFARSIPLSKALEDCILAYEMNGHALPPEHGYPVRLIVPGWYGVNSVKWVDELRVMDSMVTQGSLDRSGDHEFWQHQAYRMHPLGEEPDFNPTIDTVDTWDQLEGAVEHPYTFDLTVMSVIGTPTGETPLRVPLDEALEVRGVAWAGDDTVEAVEISTDGGESWSDAEIFGPEYQGAWRLFRYEWDAQPGRHTLMSRATDDLGRRQPASISEPGAWRDALDREEFPWNEGGYAANAYEPNAVDVEIQYPRPE